MFCCAKVFSLLLQEHFSKKKCSPKSLSRISVLLEAKFWLLKRQLHKERKENRFSSNWHIEHGTENSSSSGECLHGKFLPYRIDLSQCFRNLVYIISGGFPFVYLVKQSLLLIIVLRT